VAHHPDSLNSIFCLAAASAPSVVFSILAEAKTGVVVAQGAWYSYEGDQHSARDREQQRSPWLEQIPGEEKEVIEAAAAPQTHRKGADVTANSRKLWQRAAPKVGDTASAV